MAGTLPSWYTPEETPVQTSPSAPPAKQPLPAWYTPEPKEVTAATATPSVLDQANDLGANVLTGALRLPGAIGGIPHMIGHTANWGRAQVFNALDALTGGKGGHTGEEVDAKDPVMQVLPSSQDIDAVVEHPPLPDFMTRAVNGSGPGKFYHPESVGGRLLQAGVTGAASGGRNIPGALKTALAAMSAEGANELFPNHPAISALAAFLTHAGAGSAATAAKQGYRTFAEPIVSPVKSGEALAGKSLAAADHTQPGLAAPQQTDLDNAATATRQAVDDVGTGLDDYTAGGNIRADLQGRKTSLIAGRNAEANQNYEAFRDEPPLEGAKLGSFMRAPAFQAAVKAASRGRLNRGQSPLTGFWDFNEAGDPVLKPNAAVPPDVLQRIKGALDDDVSAAKGNVERGDLMDLRDRYVSFLDQQYPNTYPKARTDFAGSSRPLDPLTEGLPGKVLDGETQFGRQTYNMPQDKIAGAFLQSKATRTDFDSLIKAYGGDKNAALSNLEENLANKVQSAVKGDGTLSLDAFNRSVRPYTKALSMWFPQLAQKFSSAEAAQRSLETLTAQKQIAGDVAGGALRGDDGFITGSTLGKWLDRNEGKLATTQSKAAVLRLRQIAKALPDTPGGGAEAAVETAPMVIGGALGGLEGGVLGGITHKIPAYLAGPRLAKFRDAYSAAVERAVRDPVAAQQLVAMAAKRGGPQSIAQVLRENAKKAALAAPVSVTAGTPLDH
jgi:hypothetical protein